jgi:prepilin-type N-terminal cleavage/methylation domain-containing protein
MKIIVDQNSQERAFTLLELLVAMAITAVIAGLLLTITTQVLGLWQRQQGEQVQAVAARLALDLLERDWQAAIVRRDNQRWLAAEIIDTPGGLANHGWLLGSSMAKPASGGSLRPLPAADASGRRDVADARFGLSGVWLRFTTTNTEAESSLPVLVAYQIARRPITGDPAVSNPAPVRYALYRSAVSLTDSFANSYDPLAGGYGSATNSPAAYRSARSVTNPSHAGLLASNVVDFGCCFYVRTIDGSLRRIFPEAVNDIAHLATGNSTSDGTRYPEVVDVMVRVLSEAGAAQIEAMEAGRLGGRPSSYAADAEWWWAVVTQHSTVFTRRIEIKGGGR